MKTTKRTAPVLARELAVKSDALVKMKTAYAELSQTVVAQDAALNSIRNALARLEGK